MRRIILRVGIVLLLVGAALASPLDGRAQPSAPPNLGVMVPDAARAVLSQAELVEGVCLMSRWRAEEMFAAIDGVAAKQPAAQAALDKAGIKYALPNPEDFRKRGNDALGAICSAPTVDQATTAVGGLLAVNRDMEAKYGALAEAMGGEVKKAVDAREAKIRADMELFVEPRRKQAEADLRAEGQKIADRLQEQVKPKYEADINAYAQNLAKSYKPEQMASFSAALQPYIDQKIEQAKKEVTVQVEAALASRIEESKATIRAEADKAAEAMGAGIKSDMDGIRVAFDAMLAEVELRTAAAKTADTPAKRAAVEKRVQLAMKAVDVYIADAKNTPNLARAELTALKAANPGALDADALVARLDASRNKLEGALRTAANAGDEVGFTAAYTGFEASWREVAAQVDQAAGTWTPARVCQEAGSALAAAKTQAEAARSEIGNAQGGVVAAPGSDPTDQQRIQSMKDALTKSAGTLDTFINTIGQAQAACQSPSGDPRALIAQLDQARQAQANARQAYESARLLAQSLAR